MKACNLKTTVHAFAAPLVLVAALLGTNPTAEGVVSISLSDPIGDPGKISIFPGSSFTISLRLNATVEQLTGAGYSLVAPGAGAGKFTLVARNIGSTPFSDLQTPNVSNLVLTTASTPDLGGSLPTASIGNPTQPGTVFLADYTIASDPTLAPGVYFVQPGADLVGVDHVGNSVPISTSFYEVTVAPEPGAGALAFLGLGVLFSLRRAKRMASKA